MWLEEDKNPVANSVSGNLYFLSCHASSACLHYCLKGRFVFVGAVHLLACHVVQFSLVQDGIYELGKAHMRSTPSLRSFPKVAFETVM